MHWHVELQIQPFFSFFQKSKKIQFFFQILSTLDELELITIDDFVHVPEVVSGFMWHVEFSAGSLENSTRTCLCVTLIHAFYIYSDLGCKIRQFQMESL